MKLFSWKSQGQAFIDRWTFVHLAFWFVIGANLEVLSVPHAWRWPALFIGAIAWEVVETGLEMFTDMVEEPESHLNRWVSDPIMAFVGGGLGMLLIGA